MEITYTQWFICPLAQWQLATSVGWVDAAGPGLFVLGKITLILVGIPILSTEFNVSCSCIKSEPNLTSFQHKLLYRLRSSQNIFIVLCNYPFLFFPSSVYTSQTKCMLQFYWRNVIAVTGLAVVMWLFCYLRFSILLCLIYLSFSFCFLTLLAPLS